MRRKRFERGLSLIELLVVVAIIGILSAMAIVNYLNALTRARQKRTPADIRNIALAWEARATDRQTYAVAGFDFPEVEVPHEDLAAVLAPTYTKVLPRVDGWNRPLEFALNDATPTGASVYAIRSPGRDGSFETTYTPGAKTDPDCDIVYSVGGFVCYPATMQTN